MSVLTCCPSCHTVFRVTGEHLAARDGQVRCGVCSQVFNAYDYLTPEPRPSLDEATAPPEVTPEVVPEVTPEPPPESFVDTEAARVLDWSMFKFHEEPAINAAPDSPPPATPAEPENVPEAAETHTSTSPDALDWDAVPHPIAAARVSASAPEPAPAEPIAPSVAELARKQHRRTVWLGIGSGVLALMLALQAVYFWRTTLAARLPARRVDEFRHLADQREWQIVDDEPTLVLEHVGRRGATGAGHPAQEDELSHARFSPLPSSAGRMPDLRSSNVHLAGV